jgi:MinD superfamily P-loop ATPase
MKELVVTSGNGGTGKTSLLAAFASLARNKVICDAGKDTAELHRILSPGVKERHEFQSGGEWFISKTRFGLMVHGGVGIEKKNYGISPLIRRKAGRLAREQRADLLLTDGPKGTGCPVTASVVGATEVLIVVESNVSGKDDFGRVADLIAAQKVPAMLCVNKFDLNPEQGRGTEKVADKKNTNPVGRIPVDAAFTRARVAGKTIVEYDRDSKGCMAVMDVWKRVVIQLEFLYGNPLQAWLSGKMCSRLGSVGINLIWQ